VLDVPGFGHRLGGALYLACSLLLGVAWGRRSTVVAFQLGSQLLAAGACARVWSRPLVAFSTSNGDAGEVAEVLRSPRRWLHRRLLRGADRLVGQTEAARVELLELARADRVMVLANPVVLPTDVPPLDGRPRAVFAGRLAEEKGLDVLLDAWERVADGRAGARLTLVGGGGNFGSVEAELRARVLASELLRETVTFTGWVADVEPYLRDADVFVLPSCWEGLSNALLEACALRRLVVASEIPGNTEVLGADHGLLFRPGDANGLTVALAGAFDDQRLREAARRCVDESVSRFGAGGVLDDCSALLAGLSAA